MSEPVSPPVIPFVIQAPSSTSPSNAAPWLKVGWMRLHLSEKDSVDNCCLQVRPSTLVQLWAGRGVRHVDLQPSKGLVYNL